LTFLCPVIEFLHSVVKGNHITMLTTRTVRSFLATALLLLPQLSAQQWTCQTYYGQPFEGYYNIQYTAFIPWSYIYGPSGCLWYGMYPPWPSVKKYKGDSLGPLQDLVPVPSYRVAHNALVQNRTQFSSGFLAKPGQTRNYGALSPVNGYALSPIDDDPVPLDCFLWNNSAYADRSKGQIGGSSFTRFLSSWASSTNLTGTASNPLESDSAKIYWNVNVNVNSSDLNYITGAASGVHTCFPGHAISVNGKIIYQWIPTQNDPAYVFSCLVLQQNQIQFQAPTYHVPCN
jgi:hypothetical protein